MPKPKQKLIHNPFPTSLFLSLLFLDEILQAQLIVSSIFTQTKMYICRDGVMNEFLFWCRHPLVNPRRACAARVTVVGLCVRPSVR